MTKVQYVECERKDAIEKRMLEQERRKILCLEYRTGKKKPWQNWRVVVHSIEGKVQQSGTQTKVPRNTKKKKDKQRNIRRIFKILKEMWLNIRVEKVDTHEGVTVKVLLDSSITEMFIDRKIVAKYGFRLQKLNRPIMVRNVDGTNNSAEAIIY